MEKRRPTAAGGLSSDETVLRLTLEDLQRENQRLRSARAAVTSQLGPLPVSAAIVAGLVTAFTTTGGARLNHTLLIVSLAPFTLMVLVSILYAAMKPYRKLRDKAESQRRPSAASTEQQYYEDMIGIEAEVRGSSLDRRGYTIGPFRPVLPWRAETLQEAFDAEWQGLFITKLLFVATVALLILARVV